jgi:hypothetical protein
VVFKFDTLLENKKGVLKFPGWVVLNCLLGCRMLFFCGCALNVSFVCMVSRGVFDEKILRWTPDHDGAISQGRKSGTGKKSFPVFTISNRNRLPNMERIARVTAMLNLRHKNDIETMVALGIFLINNVDEWVLNCTVLTNTLD